MENLELVKVAARFSNKPNFTKKDLAAALKEAGLPQRPNIEPLEETIGELVARRLTRRWFAAVDRVGYVPVEPVRSWYQNPYISTMLGVPRKSLGDYHPAPFEHQPTGRPAVRLPDGTPEQRLEKIRKSDVWTWAKQTFRYGAAGGTEHTINLTRDPAKVSYTVTIGKNFTTYRGQYKGWAANEDHHTITVPYDWRMRVKARGLASVDGMMTLDASPMDGAPEGIELFAAVWAIQGRGFEVKTHRGVIARTADRQHAFHAASADAAIAGIGRKLRAVKQMEKRSELARLSIDEFAERVERHADIMVTLSDAKAIGACDYGIRSWCHSTGLNYDDGQAALSTILAAYKREPRPEARATIIHAIQRSKRAL